MLQPVEHQRPQNADELVARMFSYSNIVARDEGTGALLDKSRKQYTLVVPDGENTITRHYSRLKVHSDEAAIEKANKSLQRILSERAKAQA